MFLRINDGFHGIKVLQDLDPTSGELALFSPCTVCVGQPTVCIVQLTVWVNKSRDKKSEIRKHCLYQRETESEL